MYMYEGPSGERFTLYCSKVEGPETALRFKQGKQVAAFTWVEGQFGFVVSGADNREKLETVTKAIYEQVDKSGAKKS
jgi:anti-sigma factor RsiW